MADVVAILLTATSGTEAIAGLFRAKKADNPRFSLLALGRRLGIKSKGVVSEIVNGRRPLSPRHWDNAAAAFGLEGATTRYLRLLLTRDQALTEAEAADATRQLAILKKFLRAPALTYPAKLRGMFFALEVFCAFSLFKNSPTQDDLLRYFGREAIIDVQRALRLLVAAGMVRTEASRFHLSDDQNTFLNFGATEDGISQLDFFRLALDHAMKAVDEWYQKKDVAYFWSGVLSVRRDAYKARLAQLREEMLSVQTELETPDADMLVRFNVQVYPTR